MKCTINTTVTENKLTCMIYTVFIVAKHVRVPGMSSGMFGTGARGYGMLLPYMYVWCVIERNV